MLNKSLFACFLYRLPVEDNMAMEAYKRENETENMVSLMNMLPSRILALTPLSLGATLAIEARICMRDACCEMQIVLKSGKVYGIVLAWYRKRNVGSKHLKGITTGFGQVLQPGKQTEEEALAWRRARIGKDAQGQPMPMLQDYRTDS
jgi:hypothetical protein